MSMEKHMVPHPPCTALKAAAIAVPGTAGKDASQMKALEVAAGTGR